MTTVPNSLSDQQLVEAWLARKDESAIAELVVRYQPLVEAAVGRLLHDQGLAQDAIQETFLAFCDQVGNITGPIGAWLRGVAANQALLILRRHTRWQAREARGVRDGAWRTRSDPEQQPYGDIVTQCLTALSPSERDLLVRLFWENQTQQEVAVAQGVCPATVHKRVQACLDRLRRHLARRGLRISAAGLLACLGGLAGSAPESYAWMRMKTAESSMGPITVCVSTAAGLAILTLLWLVAGTAATGRPIDSEMASTHEPAPGSAPEPSTVRTPGSSRSTALDTSAQSPVSCPMPAFCGFTPATTGWTEVDPSSWRALSFTGDYHNLKMSKSLLALPTVTVVPGGDGLQFRPGPENWLAVGIPVPATPAQGFQVRLTSRVADMSPASEPFTEIVTIFRSTSPEVDIRLLTTFSASRTIRNSNVHFQHELPFETMAFYGAGDATGTNGTVLHRWQATIESRMTTLGSVWGFLAVDLDLHQIQVRALTIAERTELANHAMHCMTQTDAQGF